MNFKMVDVTLHIDENVTHDDRENLRDQILQMNGVMSADHHDERPHLIIIEYNPDITGSYQFLEIAKQNDLHAELIGL